MATRHLSSTNSYKISLSSLNPLMTTLLDILLFPTYVASLNVSVEYFDLTISKSMANRLLLFAKFCQNQKIQFL